MMKFFKESFIAGLVAMAPIGVTIYICWAVFNLSDAWIEKFGITTPGVGAAVLVSFILAVGILIRLYIGTYFFSIIEWVIDRVPPVRLIYKATKDISKTVLDRDKGAFKAVVKVNVGGEGHWALGFLTKDIPDYLDKAFGADVVAVIVFQVFSPGAGVTLFIEKDKLQKVDIPVDEALQLALTAGMMQDED